MTSRHNPPVRQTVRYCFTFLETVIRSNRLVISGTVSDKIERYATIRAWDSTIKLDVTVILRSTVWLDLRYAVQNRQRPACTPKSLRRLVYVFRLTSFLTRHVPPTLSYASAVPELYH